MAQRSMTPELDHHRNAGEMRAGAPRGGSLRQLGGVGMLQRHADEFDLTDEQLDRLEALQVACELEKVDLRAALRKAKIRLRGKIRIDEAPEAEIMAAIDEVTRCEGELRKMRYRHLQSARSVLDEQQRSKVKAFRRSQLREKVAQWRRERPAAAARGRGLTLGGSDDTGSATP